MNLSSGICPFGGIIKTPSTLQSFRLALFPNEKGLRTDSPNLGRNQPSSHNSGRHARLQERVNFGSLQSSHIRNINAPSIRADLDTNLSAKCMARLKIHKEMRFCFFCTNLGVAGEGPLSRGGAKPEGTDLSHGWA